MFIKLTQSDYYKTKSLIKNTTHELFIEALLIGNAPGEIYVDDVNSPKSALFITEECKLVAGNSSNCNFNQGIKDKLSFNDQIACDTEEWEEKIIAIHSNISLRKYARHYYILDKLKYLTFEEQLPKGFTLEYVYVDSINKISYENADKISDWFEAGFKELTTFSGYCLGSYIRTGNKIVSWCLVDCIAGKKAEIGLATDKAYRKMGLGAITAAATVGACLKSGIRQIGWQCISNNIGSCKIAEKIGFELLEKYYCFTPFPTIENISDASSDEWKEWALHYDKMNQIEPKFYFFAAICWANALNLEKTIENMKKLVDSGWKREIKFINNIEAFEKYKDCDSWLELIDYLKGKWNE